MAGTTSSRMATIVVVIPIIILAWFLAPYALPVFRWRSMNFDDLSKKLNLPASQLQQQFQVTMYYHPRNPTDPCPWQIMGMDPPWDSIDSKRDDESSELVRCTLISDRDGEPPSKFFLGSGNYKDCFWQGKVWRFPAGTFNKSTFHPVLVYSASTWDKASFTDAEVFYSEVQNRGTKTWTNDDKDTGDGQPVTLQ